MFTALKMCYRCVIGGLCDKLVPVITYFIAITSHLLDVNKTKITQLVMLPLNWKVVPLEDLTSVDNFCKAFQSADTQDSFKYSKLSLTYRRQQFSTS